MKKSDPLNIEGKKQDVTHIPPFRAGKLLHAFRPQQKGKGQLTQYDEQSSDRNSKQSCPLIPYQEESEQRRDVSPVNEHHCKCCIHRQNNNPSAGADEMLLSPRTVTGHKNSGNFIQVANIVGHSYRLEDMI